MAENHVSRLCPMGSVLEEHRSSQHATLRLSGGKLVTTNIHPIRCRMGNWPRLKRGAILNPEFGAGHRYYEEKLPSGTRILWMFFEQPPQSLPGLNKIPLVKHPLVSPRGQN